jgi:hypothetical protein
MAFADGLGPLDRASFAFSVLSERGRSRARCRLPRRPDLPLLPRASRRFYYRDADDFILAGIYENPPKTVFWVNVPLSQLPNDLIGVDDLKGAGIELIDGRAVNQR